MVNFQLKAALLFVLAITFTFLGINFNPDLSAVYMWMVVASGFALLFAWFKPGTNDGYPLLRTNFGTAFIWGAGAFAIFYLSVSFLIPQFFEVTGQAAPELVRGWAQAGVALERSDIIQFVVFSVLIPVAETLALIAAPMYMFGILAKIDIYNTNLFRKEVLLIVLLVASIFTVFHLTAKGLSNTRDLSISFIFASITVLLILKTQDLVPAMGMHIINNGNAMIG